MLSEIQTVNTPQILTIEAANAQINELIVTSEMDQDIGPIIQLNTALENGPGNTNKAAKVCTDEQDEQNAAGNLDSDDPKKNAEIECVVKNVLKAINEDQAPNKEDKKEKSSPNTIKMMR